MEVTVDQYLRGKKFSDLKPYQRTNAIELVRRINIYLKRYEAWLLQRDSVLAPQKPSFTSGVRTEAENIEIYRIKNQQEERRCFRLGVKFIPIPVATKSTHLNAQGGDLEDHLDLHKEFVSTAEGQAALEEAGLWYEDFDYTDTWVHFQSVQFASWKPGKPRSFVPY